MNRRFYKFSMGFALLTLISLTACSIDTVTDPNNPSLGSVLNDASKAELQVLVTGLEARHRNYVTNANQMFGVFGREVYAFFGSDPRFVNDWLGLGIDETYPDFFASAGTYVDPYLAVKQANVLEQSAEASTKITPEEVAAYTGLAKTIKGYQLLWPLMQQYQNGIRVDVTDPLNPGPTLSYDDALQAILDILNQGLLDLQKATGPLPFFFTAGFASADATGRAGGFNNAASLIEINRAVAARVALYAEDWGAALTALDGSFMNLAASTTADLYVGPAHAYGEAPDLNNPLFYPFDRSTSTILIVHPSMIEDALPNDGRVALKFAERVNTITNANLVDYTTPDTAVIVGRYQDARWTSNVAPFQWIRNEELILIYAEASARNGAPGDAVSAINTIRNIWGVGDYTGSTDTEALIDEILFQRRYSLWLEMGHRWIDMRRTNRLNQIDLRDQGTIFTQVSRRVSEIAWDEG